MSRTSLIPKKEEAIYESGIQIREDNPVSPFDDQFWVNTSSINAFFRSAGSNESLKQGYNANFPNSELVTLSSNEMDWTLGKVFLAEVSSNLSLAFTDTEEGDVKFLIVKNNSATSIDVIWPVGTKTVVGDSFSLAQNEANIYRLSDITGQVYVKKIFEAVV